MDVGLPKLPLTRVSGHYHSKTSGFGKLGKKKRHDRGARNARPCMALGAGRAAFLELLCSIAMALFRPAPQMIPNNTKSSPRHQQIATLLQSQRSSWSYSNAQSGLVLQILHKASRTA